jgi:hypothetical protein
LMGFDSEKIIFEQKHSYYLNSIYWLFIRRFSFYLDCILIRNSNVKMYDML